MLLQSRYLLVLLPLLLAGCGFHPLYARNTVDNDKSQVFAGVTVDPMSGRNGQMLKSNLEDQLNPDGAIPPSPAYRLNVTFNSSVVPIGVARDGTVSRYNVYLATKYVLYRIADGKPVTSGDIGYVDSYNNQINDYFSTYISEEDAYKNGITQLGELYRERLASYLSEGAPMQPVKLPDPKEQKSTVPFSPLIFNQNSTHQTPYQ
jgi:LPS-assembly lipoprotein